jgi:plastocyanin
MDHMVIIPLSVIKDKQSGLRYLQPRLIKINLHDTIRWVNSDTKSHTLAFKEGHKFYSGVIGKGKIRPGESLEMKFDYDTPRLDYFCLDHRDEWGVIVIYPKPDEMMSNTERLRFLGRVADIHGPYEHLNP